MSTGMPRPLSTTVTDSSACTVTLISSAKPAIASSTELSTTSQTRWCKPISPVEPMYIAGRRRTASRPPRTLIDFASYLWPPCGVLPTFSLSPIFSPGQQLLACTFGVGQTPRNSECGSAVKNSFSVKQGRRACGIFHASPHPVIPVSPGESRTRRVPAPSHLAQRDVAKTHVLQVSGPELLARSTISGSHLPGGRVDLKEILKRIDNTASIAESKGILKTGRTHCPGCNAFVFYYLCILLLVLAESAASSSLA